METSSVINLMPSTKAEMVAFVNKTVTAVNNGEVNPLDLSVKLKVIEETIVKLRKEISEQAINEALKYGKSFEKLGCKVEITNVGVKYDFSKCGDAEWSKYLSEEKSAADNRKEREKFLKTLSSKMTIVDEQSGEVIEINPPVKTGKESIKITI